MFYNSLPNYIGLNIKSKMPKTVEMINAHVTAFHILTALKIH